MNLITIKTSLYFIITFTFIIMSLVINVGSRKNAKVPIPSTGPTFVEQDFGDPAMVATAILPALAELSSRTTQLLVSVKYNKFGLTNVVAPGEFASK